MEVVWNLYGVRMEYVWNNTLATPSHHATTTFAIPEARRELELFQILTSEEAGLASG
jgi:hypothetical protein